MTTCSIDCGAVLDRIKELVGLDTDTKLAQYMEWRNRQQVAHIRSSKRASQLPIIERLLSDPEIRHKVDLHYLLLGEPSPGVYREVTSEKDAKIANLEIRVQTLRDLVASMVGGQRV